MKCCLILLVVFVAVASDPRSFEDDLKNYIKLFKTKRFSIFPGTKWCGKGDLAKGNELGRLVVTDACCRAHDQCDPKMRAYTTRERLTNWWPFTRLGCECDSVFYQCLKNAENVEMEAKAVGIIYFNVFKAKCFKHVQKNVCVRWSWFTCVKHEMQQRLAFVDTQQYQ